MSRYRKAEITYLDDGRIRERHFGTKDARKAKALAITNGWQYQWIENANGFHKPLRRSDCIIVRPKDAKAVPPLRRNYQGGQWELGVGRHSTLAENGQFFIKGGSTIITADLDQWDTFRQLIADMDQDIQRHRQQAEDDTVAGDVTEPRKNTTEMQRWLREIMSKEPWDENELAGWANEFLMLYEDELREQRFKELLREERTRIEALKPLVVPYRHDPALPPLPYKPDGQLHGIGFIYDEDKDDRVLIAIDDLRRNGNIVAAGEHEGELTIFTRNGGVAQRSIEVYGDTWIIRLFVPSNDRWCEVTYQHPMFDVTEFQK